VEELKQTEEQLTVEKLLQIFTLNIKNIFDSSETYFGGGSSQRERLVKISEWMLQHTPAPTDLVNLINHAEALKEKQRTTITIYQAEFLACLKWGLYSNILTHFLPELSGDRFKIGKYDVNILGTRNVFNFRNKWILNSLNVALQSIPNSVEKIFNLIHQSHSPSHSLAKPQISLIASIFNGDKFLEKFIKNIVDLTNFENMELLIIDSNSTNPIRKKLLPYLKKHPNIKIVRLEETITIYEAWNMAIKLASGEYISNVNVDDQRLKSSVFDQARFLDLNLDVDIVYGNYVYSFAPNTPIKSALKMQIKTEFPPLTTHNLLEFNSPHCAPMWRNALHREIGYFDQSLKSAADWEFWLRCANNGKKFACLEDPIAIYYFNQNGISTNSNSLSISEQWKIRTKYRQMLINETKIIGSLVTYSRA
jgi:glycosyltransferase involved in cell wall biosynthesis